ncbi:MAG: SGNH/GDSL hydrolase family protein, partial [Verrucomicrobiaceae bacterium]
SITLGGNLTTSGSNALTLTTSGTTNVTLPTSGTLVTQAALDGKASKAGSFETWVVEGDSWTAGIAQGNDRETWPYYIAKMIGPRVDIVNVASNGVTAQAMAGTFSSQCAPYLTAATGKPSTCFVFAGINDGASRTTTQVRDDLRSLWTSARNAGARVVAFTLPYRSSGGGWSQTDWAAINAQIIADSSYYDALVRTDVFHSTTNSESSDGLHVSTSAHTKLASRVMDSLSGRQMTQSLPTDYVCNSIGAVTFVAGTRRNLPVTELYDNNSDGGAANVGGNINTAVFTAPLAGTYEIFGNFCLSGMSSGDTAYLNAWVTPSGGSEVEHRLDYQVAAGANPTLKGMVRRRLGRGDTVSLAIVSSRESSSMLTNAHNAAFAVRLVSIP